MVRVEVLGDNDMDAPEYARTLEELRKIANKVFQCMQFIIDCPSIQEEGMLPVLETAMYIGKDGLIKDQFFRSPVQENLLFRATLPIAII